MSEAIHLQLNGSAAPELKLKLLENRLRQIAQMKRSKAGAAPANQASLPFEHWLPIISPAYNWQWPYIQYVRQHLDKITRGDLKRLMIFLPPRHGKTDLATIRYSAYRIEREPATRVIVGAYNQTLADKFSRKTRRLVVSRMAINQERTAVDDWETLQGGGLRAVGVGAGVTGMGGDLIVIDDPVKNREEAESIVYRDRVWDWYTNDLYTRLEPGAALILIMTRWNMDDLAGRILASDDAKNWTVLTLPAEAEKNDPLGRAEGEPLNPDRYGREELMRIKTVLGRDYHALYQQTPQPREGGMFKEHWLPIVEAVPVECKRVRWWDRAATEGGGDYTAGVLIAVDARGMVYIEDVVRGQWAAGERDQIIRLTAEKDQVMFGVVSGYWSEQEPGSSGKDAAAAFVRLLAGFPAYTEPTTGSKEIAVQPLAAQAQAGNVRVKRASWTAAFLSEALEFPDGKHDDQIESAARAYSKLTRTPTAYSDWLNLMQREPEEKKSLEQVDRGLQNLRRGKMPS